ncbi:MAG: hypothetical protein MRZ45_11085, partial [Blautia sp.]|nr:hypothetical protein [Blautia sp.]
EDIHVSGSTVHRKIQKMLTEEERDAFQIYIVTMLEKSRDEGFMEGYKYALKLLEDGLVEQKEGLDALEVLHEVNLFSKA